MKSLGINVPPGFTITTESCNSYYENGERIKPEILKQINDQLETLEKEIGKKLGSLKIHYWYLYVVVRYSQCQG